MNDSSVTGVEGEARVLSGQRAFACLVAALLWAAPRTLSVWGGAADGGGASGQVGVTGYLALVGCGLLSFVLVALSWGSRGSSEGPARGSLALTLGLGLALVPWAALAYWLSVATHHRPLGAVTYAVGAALGGALGIPLARWLLQRRYARVVALALWLSGVGGLTIVALRGMLREPLLRPVLPEALLGVALALVVVAAPALPGWRRAARWGVPVCVGVWAISLGVLASSSQVRATVKSAPIIAGIAGLALP